MKLSVYIYIYSTCILTVEERRTGESKSSAGLSPAGMEKQEGDMGGGERGREGGVIDLNLGRKVSV